MSYFIIVNDKKIEISNYDDTNIIKRKIAREFDTTIKYLFFLNKYDEKSNNVIIDIYKESILNPCSENIVNFIIDRSKYDIELKSKLKSVNFINDIFQLWIFHNINGNRLYNESEDRKRLFCIDFYTSEIYKKTVEKIRKTFTQDFKYIDSVDFVYESLNNGFTKLDEIIEEKKINEEILRKDKINTNIFNSLDTSNVIFSDLIIDSKIVQMKFKSNITMIELFNNIILDSNIPFCVYGDFYKVYKDFVPLNTDEWINMDQNKILLKYSPINYQINNNIRYNLFTNIIIENNIDDYTITFEFRPKNKDMIQDETVINILKCIKMLDIRKSIIFEDIKVKGFFFISKQYFHNYIVSDILMNDDIINRIYINEGNKTTKERNILSIKFKHGRTGYVSSLMENKVRKEIREFGIMKESIEIFPIGGEYIKVHITNSKSISSVNDFIEYMKKFVVYYNNNKEIVKNIYNNYIPVFVKEEDNKYNSYKNTDTKINSNRLKDHIPWLFTYTSKKVRNNCQKKPIVVSEEEAIKHAQKLAKKHKMDERNFRMIYPENNKYTKQLNLICDFEKNKDENSKLYIFPGLRENIYDGSNKLINHIPCCFKNVQLIPGEIDKYNISTKDTNENSNIIKTKKTCNFGQLGFLVENLDNLFRILDISDNNYYRLGSSQIGRTFTDNDINSFISCLILSLYPDIEKNSMEKTTLMIKEDIKNNLLNDTISYNVCKQQCYDMDKNEIISYFDEYSDKYIDPKLFYRIFEIYFDCNIILLSDGIDQNGTILIPRYSDNFIYEKYNVTKKFVIIYEHMGGESEYLKFPRCELIVSTRDEFRLNRDFDYDKDEIIKKIIKIYINFIKSFSLNTRIKMISQSLFKFDNIELLHQVIDNSGKTRIIRMKYKDLKFDIITEPIPPLNLNDKKFNLSDIIKLDEKNAFNILTLFNSKINKIIINESNKIVMFYFEYKGVTLSIPTNYISYSEKYSIYTSEKNNIIYDMNMKETDIIEKYNKNKKIARYLREYTIWLFSRYINSINIKNVEDENIIFFSDNYFKIVPNINYDDFIPNINFDQNNKIFDGKSILVQNEEIKLRLIYSLRIACKREYNKVLNYHKMVHIVYYYLDLGDFDLVQTQLLLYKKKSIISYISDKVISKHMYTDRIIPLLKNVYFYRNTYFGNDLYIVQNCNSIEECIIKIRNWDKNRINSIVNKNEYENLDEFLDNMMNNTINIRIYNYVNKNNINYIYNLYDEDKTNFTDCKIIVYKYEKIYKINRGRKSIYKPTKTNETIISYVSLLKID